MITDKLLIFISDCFCSEEWRTTTQGCITVKARFRFWVKIDTLSTLYFDHQERRNKGCFVCSLAAEAMRSGLTWNVFWTLFWQNSKKSSWYREELVYLKTAITFDFWGSDSPLPLHKIKWSELLNKSTQRLHQWLVRARKMSVWTLVDPWKIWTRLKLEIQPAFYDR